jgi:hypothetical protein
MQLKIRAPNAAQTVLSCNGYQIGAMGFGRRSSMLITNAKGDLFRRDLRCTQPV